MTLTKICSSCNEELLLDSFHKQKSGKYGVTSTCKQCKKNYHKTWYENNREFRLEETKQYNKDNKDIVKERSKIFREKNKERLNEESRQRYRKNKHKKKDYARNYYLSNQAAYNYRTIKRKMLLIQATPTWARTELEDFAISEMYDKAKRLEEITGNSFHVDHIVPINSNIVCGLHCLENLQLLLASENLSKSNRYWPDMP